MSDSAESMTQSVGVPARRDRTHRLVIAALLCALLAALAWVRIPVPFSPVPLTLQVFVVCLMALLLSPADVALGIGGYLLLGAVGVPVFSGGTGGIGVLVGPTGGYLVGFLVGAFIGSAARVGMIASGRRQLVADVVACLLTLMGVYGLGWAQLSMVAHLSPAAAFVAGVAPFLLADAFKAAAAIGAARILRRSGLV